MTSLPLMTASRWRAAAACQRLHRYRYGLGYAPREEAETLRFGRLVHAGLEGWWNGVGDTRLDSAMLAMEPLVADPYDRVRAEAALVGYHTRWADVALEAVEVEAEFRAPLVNPLTNSPSRTWQLGGKVDGIVRDAEGRYWLIEHKTASGDIGIGSDYWKRLRMDPQVSLYYVGAAALGYEIQGCIYDVLGKPGIRPLRATPTESRKYRADGALYANQRAEDESPEEFRARLFDAMSADPSAYFVRGEVVRLAGEVEEALYDLWQFSTQLRENERRGFFPRNPDSCVRYGRTCEFFGVCCGEASLDDPAIYRRLESPHPELGSGEAA